MKPVSLFAVLLVCSLFCASCSFHCQVGNPVAEEKEKPRNKEGMLLYNGITLNARDVKVEKAYLVTNDEQTERIAEDNIIDPEKGARLILLIREGWKETEGRVWLGASLRVNAADGQKVLDEEDLFAHTDAEGLDAEDARVIGLSVSFKTGSATKAGAYDVQFKVWDKKGRASLEGSYKLITR